MKRKGTRLAVIVWGLGESDEQGKVAVRSALPLPSPLHARRPTSSEDAPSTYRDNIGPVVQWGI